MRVEEEICPKRQLQRECKEISDRLLWNVQLRKEVVYLYPMKLSDWVAFLLTRYHKEVVETIQTLPIVDRFFYQTKVIKGFAPSAEAAKVLAEEVGIEANTVASLLCSQSPEIIEPKQIWIVDEASLLSASAAHDLLKRARTENARVLLVGDTRQLSAVEAGNPFKSLQIAGMTTAFMNQSLRQRTPELQIAVDSIARGEIDSGFERLDEANCLIEVKEAEKINSIVADYLALPQAERDKTLVLAGTNLERLAITKSIRDGLKREGQLGQSVSLTQLKSKDLTKVQMRYAHHIEIGDALVPAFDYKKRQLTKGQFYEVIAKYADSLILKDSSGNTFTVDPAFEKAVYGRSTIEIAPGDRLKWTKNDRNKGRRNGQEFTVQAIEGTKAKIEYSDGQQETIDLSVPQHLDYALVSTTYSSQGKTAERVLISADFTFGQESFYVAVSRVKSDLKLYATDKEKLLELAKASLAKENPLELLRQRVKASSKPRTETVEIGTSEKEASTDIGERLERITESLAEGNRRASELARKLAENSLSTDKTASALRPESETQRAEDPLNRQTELENTVQNLTGEFQRLEERIRKEVPLNQKNKKSISESLRELKDQLGQPIDKELIAFKGQRYVFVGTTDLQNVAIINNQRRETILKFSDGMLEGFLTQQDLEFFQRIQRELDKNLTRHQHQPSRERRLSR